MFSFKKRMLFAFGIVTLFLLLIYQLKSFKLKGYSTVSSSKNCAHSFGNVHVFVAVTRDTYSTLYKVAQASLRCYLLLHPTYTFKLTFLDQEPGLDSHCPQQTPLYRKHCAAAKYLEESNAKWLLVLDADTGVVNPKHCIEEFIDDSVDLIFYERFFNWEIASGNYLVKNTPYTRKFLFDWANYEKREPRHPAFTGSDNGALQIHILRQVLPNSQLEIIVCNELWHSATNFATYMRYVMCVRTALGSNKKWKRIKILRRAHGWVLDWASTDDRWCDKNFMMHGWKLSVIGAVDRDLGTWNSPFYEIPDVTKCAHVEWPWREENRVTCTKMQFLLQADEQLNSERFPAVANNLPWLKKSEAFCWPECHMLADNEQELREGFGHVKHRNRR